MAEVFVDLASLEAAAQHSEEASGIGGELGVGDALDTVQTAVEGGDAGPVAAKAGVYVDDLAKKLSQALHEFGNALKTSKSHYDKTDGSASVSFDGFKKALGEKK